MSFSEVVQASYSSVTVGKGLAGERKGEPRLRRELHHQGSFLRHQHVNIASALAKSSNLEKSNLIVCFDSR